MKHRIAIIAVAVFLLGILGAGCGNASIETTTPTTIDFNGVTSASSKSANGLNLSLSLDSTTYQPGQQISLVLDEKNTLSITNHVPASQNWPLEGLSLGPCGTLNYPFGMSIFQGYCAAADVAKAVPLMLYNPNTIYHCPMILSEITAYDFQPTSDIAAIFGSCSPNPCAEDVQMNVAVSETGYWTGNGPTMTLNHFTPGVYTVVGGDEWGTLLVLHFTVSP